MMVDFCLRDLKMQKARLHFVFLAILIALSGHLEALAAEGGGKGNPLLTSGSEAMVETANLRQFEELNHHFETGASFQNAGLMPEGPVFSSDPFDSAQYYVAKARAALEEVRRLGKFIGVLNGDSLQNLPVGISTEVGGHSYEIAITDIILKPRYAEIEVFMQFTVPQNGKTLTFRGKGIKLTKEGGIVGDATLQLVADYHINLDGDKSQIILKSGTYATFDCSGFQEMHIKADVKFSRDLLLPEDLNGNIQEGNVLSGFEATIRSWNDLIVQMDMPPFQVRNLQGFGFTAESVVFDFSDLQNAPSIVFPKDYQSPALLSGTPNLWRGFYLRELSVRLPREFKKQDTTERTTFTAYNVLIDDQGFSGFLEAKNLIGLDEGLMSGWAFSLDSLAIEMEANQIEQAGFNGELIIPIASEDKPFGYYAVMNPNNEYIFNLEATEDMEFDIFKTSELQIDEGSYLEIALRQGNFRPKALLHGSMDINAPFGEGEAAAYARLADLNFQDLQLQTEQPYLQIGGFSFGSEAAEQKMANLPVSINDIGFRSVSETEVALDFDLIVNLNQAFGGEAGLTMFSRMSVENQRQRWGFNRLEVNDIEINIDQGAFEFHGQLQFFRNDAVYGNGFNGLIDATFKPGVNVQASAIFGTVDGMRFWYADALASFSRPLMIAPPFGITGFGGGASYHMKMAGEGQGSDLGITASGARYLPDEEAGLGLKAVISYVAGDNTAVNGDATFEIACYSSGGVRSITFTGNVYMLTPPSERAILDHLKQKTGKLVALVERFDGTPLSETLPDDDQTIREIHGDIGKDAGEKGNISAHIKIVLDLENRSLHANMDMYINVAGGIIEGAGSDGRAGWAVLHFDPNDWYIYIGTPDDRIGIKAGVGPIEAQLTAYFMMGTKIPGSPAPPESCQGLVSSIDLDYMADENALGLGEGIGFGAAFEVDTGDLTFLIFYARFQAGLGFDIMLKNYGTNVQCKGRSEPLGINGWYANGQAYACFRGKIGIQIKLFGRRRKVDILDLQAYAILQAKLPNPFWMRGAVGGKYKVLGGLVKGNCAFEVTIGEECEIVGGSAVEGMQVIAEVTPNDGERKVDVFTAPQVVFNLPIDKEFELIDINNEKKKFRIKLDEISVSSGGSSIAGSLEWNAYKDVLAFNAVEVLPSEAEVSVAAQVSFEERSRGSWTPVIVNGRKYVESVAAAFTTDKAPMYIPSHNIQYSYPVQYQLNFYKDEYPSGYLKLRRGQAYLFKEDPEQWQQVGRFKGNAGEAVYFDYTYDEGNREVLFNLPSNLQHSTIYAFELVNIPTSAQGAIDRNVSEISTKVVAQGEQTDTEIITKEAEGTISELQEQTLFESHFRTSRFSTLAQKLNAAAASSWRWPIRNGVHEIGQTIENSEFFDQPELMGSEGHEPLIQLEAVLSNNAYYNNLIKPITYEGYPLEGRFRISDRDEMPIGIPPNTAVFIRQYPRTDVMLTSTEIALGYATNYHLSAAFVYNQANYYQKDQSDLQTQVANYYADEGGVSQRLRDLLIATFPVVLQGPYDVKVHYVLPGKNVAVSENTITITNPVSP
jgi:hypothetical protein